MAHVVPKREPCKKCNNPVFLAERLLIDESLYHRTCFRCARCDSILTVGSFYATEKDHEYCCETCPDEEKKSKIPKIESNRLSIAQRIALFERDSTSVLKKSLSDEEKSKSLSRQSPAKSEALTNFLTTQVQAENDKMAVSSSSESESDEEDSIPPSNGIPSISDKKVDISEPISKSPDNSVVTKELTSGKAIAETTPESHEIKKDIESAHKTVAESNRKVPKASFSSFSDDPEEIDRMFEKLVEDVVVESSSDSSPESKIFEKPRPLEKKLIVEEKKLIVEKKKMPLIEEKLPIVEEKLPIVEENKPLVEEAKVETNLKIEKEEKTIKKEEFEMESPEVLRQDEIKAQEIELTENTEEKVQENLTFEIEDEKVIEAPQNIINETIPIIQTPPTPETPKEPTPPPEETSKISIENDIEYPVDLNPFGEDEEVPEKPKKRPSLNPFGSESEDENESNTSKGTTRKPPRPPLPRTAITKSSNTNPFGSDGEDDSQKSSLKPRTPVPTPRKGLLHSTTPEPSPRSIHDSPGHSFRGSTSSLSSSTDGMSLRRKKKKAPAPPPPVPRAAIDSDSSSNVKTPTTTPRKKRPAPTPPTSTPKASASNTPQFAPSLYTTAYDFTTSDDPQSTSEANESQTTLDSSVENVSFPDHLQQRRLIPLEESLIEEGSSPSPVPPESEEVTYRRKIVPLSPDDNFENHLERSKDNKEAQNRQRQSQGSISVKTESESNDSMPYLNKSSHGKWKRRKGPAPALPGFSTPQRRILQMLPLQEIRQELEVIEVQQQGLEKQGVMLEKMIRERCEGSADNRTTEELLQALPETKNPKEVEELILQLFELVNEKNELFRRQAELMYLRRAHRLEEEQADVEYEIRTLMAQPEQNKTDSDKAKEEALIARLVEIVQLRNEVVDNLDRDRLREAEEDLSIKQRMESHTAKLDQDYLNQTPTKLSKKEKKKLKEAKKLKNKKLDADKDLDTSEMKSETSEKKKKKKKFLF